MNWNKLTSFLFIMFMFQNAAGQNKTLVQVTPKSPNVAGFDKYLDVPVSLSSGMVDLNVPLYTIKAGSVEIPINLNYHSNGLKTDEIPSWVGLGWSLSTGGVISYHQRGLNDFDKDRGILYGGAESLRSYQAGEMNNNTALRNQYFENILQNFVDSERDYYTYTLPNQSGSFCFLTPTDFRTNPKTDVSVSKTDLGFKMLDDKGNAYFFETKEAISTQNADEVSPDFNDNSAFYLSKIITINGDPIVFKYKSFPLTYSSSAINFRHSTTYSRQDIGCPMYGESSVNSTITRIQYALPDSIIFKEGYVKFNLSVNKRQDLMKIYPQSTVPYLAGFSVYDYRGNIIKTYSFSTSYFGNGDRLKLDGITESYGLSTKKWNFQYYNPTFNPPALFSPAKDHWGYTNENFILGIPNADYASFMPNWRTYGLNYANRNSDFRSSLNGMIKSITYPTGGNAEFTYEPNQFKYSSTDIDYLGEFLKPAISPNTFDQAIVNVTINDGTSLTGSFTIPTSGYYQLSTFKQLSPDPFYDNADIVVNGPSAYVINNKTSQCNGNQCVVYQVPVLLSAGVYTYTVKGSYYTDNLVNNHFLNASFLLLGANLTKLSTYIVGGNRIAKIVSTDPTTNQNLISRYLYNDSLASIKFGKVDYISSYTQNATFDKDNHDETYVSCGLQDVINSQNVISSPGNVIEYKTVTEIWDEAGSQGKKIHQFLLSDNVGNTFSQPFTEGINTSWRAGALLKEQFILAGSGNKIIAESTSNYLKDFNESMYLDLKVDYSVRSINSIYKQYRTNSNVLFSENFKKISDSQINYFDSGNVSTNTSYEYNISRHNNISNKVTSNSNSSLTQEKTTYVFDYDNLTSNTPAISGLNFLKRNFINKPVEEITIKTINGNQFVIGGTLKTYKPTQPVVDAVYSLEVNTPIPITSFTFSNVNSSGEFINDNRYKLKATFEKYDNSLNLIDQKLQDGTNLSYLWGYNKLYVIADVTNASSVEFYYEGFEENPLAINTVSHTGRNCILSNSNNYSVNWLKPNQRNYVISYWYKDNINSKWFYSGELPYTGNYTINYSYIDDIRIYPADAQIRTYTYSPLIGITSQSDAKGQTTYYEYDEFQRLKNVKDQKGNILKNNTYHYKP